MKFTIKCGRYRRVDSAQEIHDTDPLIKDSKALSEARESIRINIDNAGLRHTIGQRYPSRTAHCTLLRFVVDSLSTGQFLRDLTHLRHANIGDCRINEAFLVFNDWYHTPGIVQ